MCDIDNNLHVYENKLFNRPKQGKVRKMKKITTKFSYLLFFIVNFIGITSWSNNKTNFIESTNSEKNVDTQNMGPSGNICIC